jgi:hypothetical protein
LGTFLISPMCAARPTPLIFLDLVIPVIFGEVISYEAPHYAVLSSLLSLPPSLVHISPQYPVLRHLQSLFFP